MSCRCIAEAWGRSACRRKQCYRDVFQLPGCYPGRDSLRPSRRTRATMGETVPPLPGLRLEAGGRLPEGARLVLIRDGKRLVEATKALLADVPGPGVYRVEVRVEGARRVGDPPRRSADGKGRGGSSCVQFQ